MARRSFRSGSAAALAVMLATLALLACSTAVYAQQRSPTLPPSASASPTTGSPTMSPVYQCNPANFVLKPIALQACMRGMSVEQYCKVILFQSPHNPAKECEEFATNSPTMRPSTLKPTRFPTQKPQSKEEYELYRTAPPTWGETDAPTTLSPTRKGDTRSPTPKPTTKSPTTNAPTQKTGGAVGEPTRSPVAAQDVKSGGGGSGGAIAAVLVVLVLVVVGGLWYRRRRRSARFVAMNNLNATNEWGQGERAGGYKPPGYSNDLDLT